jgi:hypothetical protein
MRIFASHRSHRGGYVQSYRRLCVIRSGLASYIFGYTGEGSELAQLQTSKKDKKEAIVHVREAREPVTRPSLVMENGIIEKHLPSACLIAATALVEST